MNRGLVSVLLVVLAGVCANVGVSWWCVWRVSPAYGVAGAGVVAPWPSGTPVSWGPTGERCVVADSFGAFAEVYFGEGGTTWGSGVQYDSIDSTGLSAAVIRAGWPLPALRSVRWTEHVNSSVTRGDGRVLNYEGSRAINTHMFIAGWEIGRAPGPVATGFVLPLKPVFPGFVVNSLFWAAAVAVVAGFVRFGALPRLRRRVGPALLVEASS